MHGVFVVTTAEGWCDKHVARVALGAVFAGTSSQGCGHKHGSQSAPCSPHNVNKLCPPAAGQLDGAARGGLPRTSLEIRPRGRRLRRSGHGPRQLIVPTQASSRSRMLATVPGDHAMDERRLSAIPLRKRWRVRARAPADQ